MPEFHSKICKHSRMNEIDDVVTGCLVRVSIITNSIKLVCGFCCMLKWENSALFTF